MMFRYLRFAAVFIIVVAVGCSRRDTPADPLPDPARNQADSAAVEDRAEPTSPDRAAGSRAGSSVPAHGVGGEARKRAGDETAGERSADAAGGASDPGGDEARTLLARMSSDASIERRSASEALDQLGEGAMPHIVRALRHGTPAQRRGAATFLIGRVSPRDDQAVGALVEALAAEDDVLRHAALQAVAHASNEQLARALPALVSFVENDRESESYRSRAVRTIGRLEAQGRPAVAALIALHDRESSLPLRRAIYFAVAKAAAAKDAEAFFTGQFQTGTPADLRRLAAKWLAVVARTDHALETLVAAFRDPEKEVRMQASDTLVALGKPAVPTLIKGLETSDVQTRRYSVMTLGKLRHLATAAVPALKERLGDPDKDVQQLARAALQLIPPRP